MGTSQILNPKGTVRRSSSNDMPFSPIQPVIAHYTTVSTLNQTVINLSFSVDQSLTDQFTLYIDGKLMTLGSSNDYTFTNVQSDNTSSQVTLNFSITANLNIQAFKLGLKKESEFQTDNRFVALYAALTSGFQSFVSQTDYTLTPTTTTGTPAAGTFYSSITKRASITDLSQDLKPRFGLDRVMTPYCEAITGEFGSSGQPVFRVTNDTQNRVRLIGGGWTPFGSVPGASANGSGVYTNVVGDSVEITFYGTGLNLLLYLTNSARTFNVSVDGVAQPSVTYSASSSTMITSRNQNANIIGNMVNGLSLGVHTVTVSLSSGADLDLYGYEVLCQPSTGSSLINVNPGIMYGNGQKILTSAQATFAYNSPVTGTTGGRVAVYQTSAGAIGEAFTQNAASPSYMGSANHSNEEVVRAYHFREFGYGTGNDLAYFNSTTAVAGTVDDGLTTMVIGGGTTVTNTGANGIEYMALNANGAYFTINFIGTGLDIQIVGVGSAFDNHTVFVDGVSQSTTLTGSATDKIVTIASGLSYGSHCVQIERTAAVNTGIGFYKFIVYRPKTPSIPSGATLLGTYNTFGSFSQGATATGQASNGAVISPGTMRKMNMREMYYFGTWTNNNSSGYPSGYNPSTSTAGSYVQYSFFGTGCVYVFANNAGAQSFTVSVDGASNFSVANSSPTGGVGWATATTNLSATAGLSFTNTTGVVTGSPAASAFNTLSISGLTLGLHTIKVLWSSGAAIFPACFDIITPIHSPKSVSQLNIQSALEIGSQGISDERKTSAIKEALSSTKGFATAYGVISGPTTSATSPVPMPDMSCEVKTNGGPLLIGYNVLTGGVQQTYGFVMYVDGVQVSYAKETEFSGTSSGYGAVVLTSNDIMVVPVAAGVHRVSVYWFVTSSTASATSINRNMFAVEL